MEPEKIESVEEKNDNQKQKMNYHHMHCRKPFVITGFVILAILVIGAVAMTFGHGFRNNDRGFRNNVVIEREGTGFGMGRGGMMKSGEGIRERGNLSGSIKAIDGNNLTVTISSKDVTVVIADDTSIYNSDGSIASKSDLKVNQSIAIVGRPNSSGQINPNTIIIK